MWIFLFLPIFVSCLDDYQERTWKTEDRKYEVDATFVKMAKGKVTLRRNDDTTIEVDVSRLCELDKRYIVRKSGWGRVWIDDTGKHATIADLVEFKNKSAKLELLDGTQIDVPLARFSGLDQRYLIAREIAKADSAKREAEEKKKKEMERLKALDSIDVAKAESIDARVVGVTDGDTVTVLVGTTQHKIRLEGIDAPEISQAFGKASKKHLSTLCFSKPVTLKPNGRDKYRRILATILVGGVNANKRMVADGYAWHFKKYSTDKNLAALESSAKAKKTGLWSEANPIPPWDFRKNGSVIRKKILEEKTETKDNLTRGPPPPEKKTSLSHWLNTSSSSNKRHNASCRWYKNTKRGRMCGPNEGSACGICGG